MGTPISACRINIYSTVADIREHCSYSSSTVVFVHCCLGLVVLYIQGCLTGAQIA
jgi:hypothetical protein